MARLPRLRLAGWPHLVVQRVHDGQALCRDGQDRVALLDTLREASRTLGVAVHAYRVSEDRLYLVVTPSTDDGLSLFMQAVGRRYVAAYNRRHGRTGGLWSGRYRGTVLDSARYLLDAMLFVELAGEPHGGEAAAVAAACSSAAHHLGVCADPLVSDSPQFWALGNTPFDREAAWRRRLEEGLPRQQALDIADAMHKGWALIPAERQTAMAAQIGRPVAPRPRGRPRKTPAAE